MDDKMILVHSKDICHHGVDGQKWGKRQYQYDDGSLTPLGRIHYGVGQAKEASKIKIREMKAETRNAVKLAKAQAKTANEVAKAEAKKLEAEAKAYRDRKEADKMVELERIKNDREADRNAAKLEEKRIDNEDKLNRDLAEASKEQVESEKSSSNALKVVGGILVAAGVGYLLYRAVKGSSVTSESNIEAGKNAINNVSDKPASSFFNTANETQRQKDLIGKAIKDKNAAEASFIKSQAKAAAKEAKRQKDLITQAVKASNKAKAKEAKAAAKELKRQQNLIKKTINFENNSKKSWYVDPQLGNKFRVTTEGRGSRLSNWLFGPITTRSEKAQKTLDAIDSWKKRRLYMSDSDGMILIHSATAGRDVEHWGILGQKWGVRRYQNPDGSLTELGKQHYGKKEGKKLAKAKTYGEKFKIAEESKIVKEFKKNSDEYADLQKHYKELEGLGENITRMQVDEFKEHMHGVKDVLKEELSKYMDQNANDFLYYASNEMNNQYANLIMQPLKREAKEAKAELKNEKLLNIFDKQADKERIDKAAELGLKALAKRGDKDVDPNDKDWKDWFVYEDQTIGLPHIADLVNQGKTRSEIIQILDKACKADNDNYYDSPDFNEPVANLAESGWRNGGAYGKSRIEEFIDNCIEVKKDEDSKLKHSDNGEDVQHWGIKGQRWGVRRWQYEDGTLTPEGRIHYGRISEKGQQEGRLTGRTAKYNTREFNTLNRRMARNASKYEKTGKRKYAERALENAELLSNEKFVKNEAKIMNDQSSAYFVLGIPGQILMAAANSSLLKEDHNIWNETKTKFQNMSLEELDKAFNETIGKTEKVKFNAKEMDKETKAKKDAVFKESKEYRENGGQYKDEKEARKAYETHMKDSAENQNRKNNEKENLAENQRLYKQLMNAKNIDEYVNIRDKISDNQKKSGKRYSMDFQELVQNDKRQYNTEWMDKESAKYNADPKKYWDEYRQKMEDPEYRKKYQE